jgi:hypothetical protein
MSLRDRVLVGVGSIAAGLTLGTVGVAAALLFTSVAHASVVDTTATQDTSVTNFTLAGEPATLSLMMLGFASLGAVGWRKGRKGAEPQSPNRKAAVSID